ncbi:hypothetical protein D1AOALGA4SA_4854 [Olavius algarvensis Delta 1 endosymbiont]|nr:hypothetical protein D1AOALGA4SA_4854 [Olavius algarvensis Delta 1 endosymbiont]
MTEGWVSKLSDLTDIPPFAAGDKPPPLQTKLYPTRQSRN